MTRHTENAENNCFTLGVAKELAQAPLSQCVEKALEDYFQQLDGQPTTNLYHMLLTEVEVPLFKTVLEYTHGNQSRAAEMLGINRGTLRKKLNTYGL